MRQLQVGLLALISILANVGYVGAATLIDFEAFSDGANLDGVNLGGVTLTGPNGVVEVFDDRFGASYHSATKAVAAPEGCENANPLTGVFDVPVRWLALWSGDAGTQSELDSWKLAAFDAPVGGNLIGSATSDPWDGDPYRQLKVSAEEPIYRFEAHWTGQVCGVGFDDLEFQVVPEPSTILLAATGLLGVLLCAGRGKKRSGRCFRNGRKGASHK